MDTTIFSKIQPLWDQMPILPGASQGANAGQANGMFADIFRSAIDNVRTTDAEKNKMQYLLSVGELDNPADLTIAATKAQMSVDMLIQLRNKALEAYSEITRISL